MMISVRQEYILKTIRRSSNGMKGQEICEKMQISNRTFRDDMKQLQAFLDEYGVEIRHNPETGFYYILQKDKAIVQKIIVDKEKLQEWIPEDSMEREFYILFELLWNEDYIVAENLAAGIFISKATMSKDIKRVSKWIDDVIGTKPEIAKGKGIRLIASEADKRRLISSAVYRYYESDCKYLMKIYKLHAIDETRQEYKKLNQKMYSFFYEREIYMDQESFLTLILEIIAYVTRLRQGYSLDDMNMDLGNVMDSKDSSCLPFDYFEDLFQVTLGVREKLSLLGIYRHKSFFKGPNMQIKDEVENIFSEFCRTLYETCHIEISMDDENLILRWKRHLSNMLYKCRLGYQIDQAMAEEILKSHEELEPSARYLGDIVAKHAKVKMSKMDYAHQVLYIELAKKRPPRRMKIAIASNNSHIIIESMKNRIERLFYDKAEVTGIYAVAQLPQLKINPDKPDLILATHLIQIDLDIPVLWVSGMFNLQEDVDKLGKIINLYQ